MTEEKTPKKAPKDYPQSVWLQQKLYTVAEYAIARGVARVSVYIAMYEGRIIPTLIGESKSVFIDIDLNPIDKKRMTKIV